MGTNIHMAPANRLTVGVDLDLGRELSAGVADNRQWRAGRPGQITCPRAALIGVVRRIVEAS